MPQAAAVNYSFISIAALVTAAAEPEIPKIP